MQRTASSGQQQGGRPPLDTPRFHHNCRRCHFLGRYLDFDLYAHDQDDTHTVIARYGNDARAALIGLGGGRIACEPLRQGLLRARQRGLLGRLAHLDRTALDQRPLTYLVVTDRGQIVAVCPTEERAAARRAAFHQSHPVGSARVEPGRLDSVDIPIQSGGRLG